MKHLLPAFPLGLLLLATSCGERRAAPPPQAGSTATNLHAYQVKGVIQKLPSDGRTVVIQHEEIPDYMSAMSMPFRVKDTNVLRGLQPGDAVAFRLLVNEDEGWIDAITRVAGATAAVQTAEPVAPANGVAALNPGDLLPDFTFTNELGQAIRFSQFRGSALAFTFIFTRCPFPEFCPRMCKQFLATSQQLATMANAPTNWHLLSISFDPDHDTPAVLKAYAERYGYDPARWSFATTSAAEIARLAPLCDLMVRPEGESFMHNLRTVVVDAEGRVRRVFTDNVWTADELANEIVQAASARQAMAPQPPASP